MTWPKVLGLLIGFAGVVVLMSDSAMSSTSSLLGQAAVILASVFYAGSSVLARRTTEMRRVSCAVLGHWLPATAMRGWPLFCSISLSMPQLGRGWLCSGWRDGSGLAFVMAYYLIHENRPTARPW
jgi:drug/metabolite transporter (DMT)-like permease